VAESPDDELCNAALYQEPTSAQSGEMAWQRTLDLLLPSSLHPRLGERSNNFSYSCVLSWAPCCEHPTAPALSVSGIESVLSSGRRRWGLFFSLSSLVYTKHNSSLLKAGRKFLGEM